MTAAREMPEPAFGGLEWMETAPFEERWPFAKVWAMYAETSEGCDPDAGTLMHLKWTVSQVERLLARVAELEAERHQANEWLEDAAKALRAKDQRIAELETDAALVHEYRVPLPDGPGGYAEVVVERNGQTDLWAVTDGSFSARQAWTPQAEWRFISDIGRAEAYCYSRFDALQVAVEVAEFEAAQRDAKVRFVIGGAS